MNLYIESSISINNNDKKRKKSEPHNSYDEDQAIPKVKASKNGIYPSKTPKLTKSPILSFQASGNPNKSNVWKQEIPRPTKNDATNIFQSPKDNQSHIINGTSLHNCYSKIESSHNHKNYYNEDSSRLSNKHNQSNLLPTKIDLSPCPNQCKPVVVNICNITKYHPNMIENSSPKFCHMNCTHGNNLPQNFSNQCLHQNNLTQRNFNNHLHDHDSYAQINKNNLNQHNQNERM